MNHRTEQPETIAELRALLEAQRTEFEARLAQQDRVIATLSQKSTAAFQATGKRRTRLALSRASLLKGAAAGVAGLAAAELSGTLSATPSFATTTDTNLVATGGSGTGVQVGAKSTFDYGYFEGGLFYGNGAGVVGYAVDGAGSYNAGTGVLGQSGTGIGVLGTVSSGDGVQGQSGSGVGVHGHSPAGIGVQAQSDNYLGGWFGGGLAPIYLQPHGMAGPPGAGNHYQGEIMIDNTGVPYVCSTGDGTTLGTWQAIGNLRSFPNPRRVYQNTSVSNGNNYPTIDATKKLNSSASGVPAGAAAAYCAVQANPTSANPRLAIGANDGTFNSGIANYTAPVLNTLNLTYMLVPLSSDGKFQFTSYLDGAVYIDVWGFML